MRPQVSLIATVALRVDHNTKAVAKGASFVASEKRAAQLIADGAAKLDKPEAPAAAPAPAALAPKPSKV